MFQSDDSKRYPRSLKRVVWLVLPVWVVLAVELLGGWRFGKPINVHGQYWTIVYGIVSVVVISPMLVITAFVLARGSRAEYHSRTRLHYGILLLLAISLLVSMFSCAWSCGGHPTWTSGYRN